MGNHGDSDNDFNLTKNHVQEIIICFVSCKIVGRLHREVSCEHRLDSVTVHNCSYLGKTWWSQPQMLCIN